MDDKALRYLLSGGNRRSIGKVDEAVARISGSPAGIAAAVRLMRDADPVVGMRAADALEKATRGDPGLLTPHKRELLGDIAANPQQEVRWHVLQMLPLLPLTASERAKAFAVAVDSLDHHSRIVVADALSAMFDLSVDDGVLRERAMHHAERLLSSRSAAVRSRAGRLLSGG